MDKTLIHECAKNIDLDFIENADNVYRTEDYIVKQLLHTVWDEEKLIQMMGSEDTFYKRTKLRDSEYELIFMARGKDINGKRIHSSFYTRKYVD